MLTPTFTELERLLQVITEAGLDIHIRGNIYLSKEYQDTHGGGWSALIDPSNPKEFFEDYTSLWLEWIPLLNKYNVKLVTPLTEMDNIEKYPELIKKMYTTISTLYDDGEMGFEESTVAMLIGESPVVNDTPISTERGFRKVVQDFTFWDWKDSEQRPMRIEYSCWLQPLETQKDQRVSLMIPNFVGSWSIPVNYNRSRYPQNSQMFGEIGTYDFDGIALGSSYWRNSSKKFYDEQEFADVWYTYIMGAKKIEDGWY